MTGQRSLVGAAVAATISVVLAACGSQLDPRDVQAAAGAAAVGGLDQGVAAPDLSGAADAGGSGGPGSVGDDGAGPASGAGTGGAGSGVGTPGGGDARAAGGRNAAAGAGRAGDCKGLRNQTGITDKTITIANVSDISGPVPGLFESAQQATRAYVAYFNATSDICGRKLEVVTMDSRTDAGGDQQGYTKACEKAFAAVGSMSAFDAGGAATADGCGIPDIRSTSVTPERTRCASCFSAQAVAPNLLANSVPDYFVKRFPETTRKAAMLALNVQATKVNADSAVAAYEKRGFEFVYQDTIDVSEFNYAPYVQQMKERGVRWVRFLGAYQQAVRLAQAMQQQGFKPDVFLQDSTVYDPRYVETGGDAVEGTWVMINIVPFEEAARSREMQLYQAWLQQVKPGATPDFFGVYAWSAARLFVEQAIALGGDLTRARLVERVRRVDDWTGNGIHSPQGVGPGRTSECWAIVRLEKGRWVRKAPGKGYMCSGLTDSGVGG
jgi:ABC-type branched-subunit amino acid transport system substrate-binding protein